MTDDTEPVWPFVPSNPPPPPAETAAFPPVADELAGIPSAAEFPPAPTEAFALGSSGIDALFGESNFVEYDEGPTASENPFAKKGVDPSDAGVADDSAHARTSPQVVLLWVAGSVVALLALVALFLLGTKLPTILGPAPGAAVVTSASPSASPTPTTPPIGPVAPGVYQWDALLGGECVAPYVGPWAQKYTVVDCETPHPAQVVTKGTFATAEGVVAYPGAETLQSQVNLLCTSPTVVDYAKANAYTDIQYQASYALSEQEWNDGNHFYYCFLSRSAAGDITGTIAVPQVAPVPAGAPAP